MRSKELSSIKPTFRIKMKMIINKRNSPTDLTKRNNQRIIKW